MIGSLLTAAGAVALVAVAAFVNGLLATVEDDLPGGFHNPDGAAPLSVASTRIVFGGRILAALILGTLFVLGARDGWQAHDAAERSMAAVFCAFFAVLLAAVWLHRRWLLWSALPLLAAGMVWVHVEFRAPAP